MFSGKSIKGKLSVVSDKSLYYTHNANIHNLDQGFAWEKLNEFCLDTLCFVSTLMKELKYFFN